MIKKITLINFQAHKKLEVDCGPLTTLTGGSNGGKSAVLRAVLGLIRNDSVAEYVRHGQKELSVTLEFDDGNKVEWRKGSGVNKYILTTSDGVEQEFDKVGADVPDEIRDVLKLGPIVTKSGDKEFVNVHAQLDAPFLISSTPGAVAKLFGELTSASQLYAAVNEGNKQARSTNALRTTRKKDLKDVNDSFSEFAGLDVVQDALERGRSSLEAAVAVDKSLDGLTDLIAEVTLADSGIKSASEAINKYGSLASVDLDRLEDLTHTLSYVEDALSTLREFSADISVATAAIERLSPLIKVNLDDLQKVESSIFVMDQFVKTYDDNYDKLLAAINTVEDRQLVVHRLDDEIVDALSDLDSCPHCGSELDEESKQALINGEALHEAC